MGTDKPAILLVDPVRKGVLFRDAARDLGFTVASVYTLDYIANTPGHEKGDDVSLYASDPDEAARQVVATGLDVQAVVPATEEGVYLADMIAERLELPGNDHSLAWARRNKAAMRARALEAGVRIPEFRLVHTVEEITEAARELGFPAIVKPTMGACSQGVTVLSDADALSGLDGLVTHDVFHEPITEWLVERYIRGREIAVNFFSADGDHRVVDMWEYGQPDSGDYDFPLWDILQIDETHPDWERVEEYVREALDAFGIQRGPSHTEVKCNADGVHLMETGARLSGGPAVELWAKYSDIRPFHDAIDSYLGRRPAIMDKPLGFQAVFGSVVIRNDDAPGTLVAVHGLEKLDGLPGVEEVAVGYRPGDRVPLTRDSVSIPFSASVSGPDKDAVLNTLHTIRSLVTLEIKPDPVPMATADGNTKP